MSKWYVNEAKKMSVLWYGLNPDLVIEYRSASAVGNWITIGIPTGIGDNMHTIEHTFSNLGEYFVRVRDINTNIDIITKLSVVVNDLANLSTKVDTKTTDIKTDLATLDTGLRQVLGQVTDQVNENQTIIEKTGFKVTI